MVDYVKGQGTTTSINHFCRNSVFTGFADKASTVEDKPS